MQPVNRSHTAEENLKKKVLSRSVKRGNGGDEREQKIVDQRVQDNTAQLICCPQGTVSGELWDCMRWWYDEVGNRASQWTAVLWQLAKSLWHSARMVRADTLAFSLPLIVSKQAELNGEDTWYSIVTCNSIRSYSECYNPVSKKVGCVKRIKRQNVMIYKNNWNPIFNWK